MMMIVRASCHRLQRRILTQCQRPLPYGASCMPYSNSLVSPSISWFSANTEEEFPRMYAPLALMKGTQQVADVKVYIVNREALFPSLQQNQEDGKESCLSSSEEESNGNEKEESIDTTNLPWPYSKLGKRASQLRKPSGGVAVVATDGTEQQDFHIIYSVGSEKNVSQSTLYKAGYSIRKELQKLKAENADIYFDFAMNRNDVNSRSCTDSFLQSLQGANYQFSRHLTRKSKKDHVLKSITSGVGPIGDQTVSKNFSESVEDYFDDGSSRRNLAHSMYLARDLANEREEHVNCESFEKIVQDLANRHGAPFYCNVIKGDKLLENNLNMIYAVGQASRYEPRLVELRYIGDPSREKEIDIAVVGKGIVFDSGGLNLKPTGNIENMHMDMGGAAAALGAAHGVALQHVNKNILFSFPLAENCVDSLAYKPHAILKSAKGITVEVGNTDAEGRLVLADAFTHAQETYNPKEVIDIATLTGACVIALGEEAGGLFSNSDDLANKLMASGEYVHEPLWRLPIFDGHRQAIRTGSSQADIMSTGTARAGGASTAAAFLEQFIDKGVSWAHLDIAGAGMLSKSRGHFPKGGSGFGAALLTHYLSQH